MVPLFMQGYFIEYTHYNTSKLTKLNTKRTIFYLTYFKRQVKDGDRHIAEHSSQFSLIDSNTTGPFSSGAETHLLPPLKTPTQVTISLTWYSLETVLLHQSSTRLCNELAYLPWTYSSTSCAPPLGELRKESPESFSMRLMFFHRTLFEKGY